MDHKYHEHDFEIVEKPAVKRARSLCLFVLAIAIGVAAFYLQAPPATKALIDAYDFWPCFIVGVFVAIVTLKAKLS